MKRVLSFARHYILGLVVLGIVFLAVRYVVNKYRKPGSMTTRPSM